MSTADVLAGLLKNYLQPAAAPHTQAEGHFDQVASAVPPGTLASGITAAFESPETPPFAQMVAQLFANSDPTQRAAMLTTLLNAIPAEQRVALSKVLGGGTTGAPAAAAPTVTPQQAQQVSPADVTRAAEQAAASDPSIVGKLGSFYAQHPTLVKSLGSLAMIIAMRKIARNYTRG
ncbi:MAG: hypothetical protein WCE48_01160 [Steroidobacteraceae bacterium]